MSTTLYISNKNITDNFVTLKNHCNTSVLMCSSVKANAYGHGLIQCAHIFHSCHADYLGISHISEAVMIIQAGVYIPFLLYSPARVGYGDHTCENNLAHAFTNKLLRYNEHTPCIEFIVGEKLYLKEIIAVARKYNSMAIVHLKCDTGMGRLGTLAHDFVELYEYATSYKEITVRGICSHFSDSADTHVTTVQHAKFTDILMHINQKSSHKQKILVHIANSGALLWHNNTIGDLVRPGIALYGVNPEPVRSLPSTIKLKPAMRCVSHVSTVRHMPAGHSISYGSTYKLAKDSYIAIIAAGYGDGIPVALSNKGMVCINKILYPIIGRVCMDMLMVNLNDNKHNVQRNDEVTLWGNEILPIEDQARRAGTISYELLCNAGSVLRSNHVYI